MPGLTTTSHGTGAYDWLLNDDGLDEGVSGVIDVSTFTANTHYPNGYFPSGLPVRIDDRDVIRPWADVSGARLGFLKGDHKTNGTEDVNAAVVVRGNIITARVNAIVTFVVPTTVVQPQFAFWA
jgi:hypothetical protein